MRYLLLLPLLLACLIGCSSDSSPATATRLRVIHLSPNGGNFDISHQQRSLLVNAPYTTSTGFLTVDGGVGTVRSKQTGTSGVLMSTSRLLSTSGRYTYVLLGLMGNLQDFFIEDLGLPPVTNGQSVFRLYNAAGPIGPLDLYVTVPFAPLNTQTPIATNVAYKNGSAYVSIAPGVYQIRAAQAGTLNEVFTTGFVTFAADDLRTAFIVENGGGGAPFGMVMLDDE